MATNKKILLLASFLFLASLGLTSCNLLDPGKATKIVLKAEAGSTADALQRTCTVLKQRLKGMVNDPEAVSDPAQKTITVTFKSKKSIDRIKHLLLVPGDLTLFSVYDNESFFRFLVQADDTLALILPPISSATDTSFLNDYLHQKNTLSSDEMNKMEHLHPLRSILLSNSANGHLKDGPEIGYAITHDTARINRYLSMDIVKQILPEKVRFVYGLVTNSKAEVIQAYPIFAIKTQIETPPFALQGHVTKAEGEANKEGTLFRVNVYLDKEGSKLFEEIINRNLHNHLAFVFDNCTYSCSRVGYVTNYSSLEMYGMQNLQQAEDMAHILLSGKLPQSLSFDSIETEHNKK